MANHFTETYAADAAALRAERRAKLQAERDEVIVVTGKACATGPVLQLDPNTGLSVTQRMLDTLCVCGAAIGEAEFTVLPRSGSWAHLPCADFLHRGKEAPTVAKDGELF